MAEPKFSMNTDDDLPRTLRREKQAREQEAREREAGIYKSMDTAQADYNTYNYNSENNEVGEVSVRYLHIPFFHLMFFFIKAIFAAIPALIILGAILYGTGQILKSYFPWLIQAEILIRLPGG